MTQRLVTGYRQVLSTFGGRHATLSAKLDGLGPLGVLARGYSLVWTTPDGRLVNDVSQVAVGDRLNIQFHNGRATVSVEDTSAS